MSLARHAHARRVRAEWPPNEGAHYITSPPNYYYINYIQCFHCTPSNGRSGSFASYNDNPEIRNFKWPVESKTHTLHVVIIIFIIPNYASDGRLLLVLCFNVLFGHCNTLIISTACSYGFRFYLSTIKNIVLSHEAR